MSTLSDYARQQYPNHATDLWHGINPPLQDHTVVVHVIGRETAERTIGLLERSARTEEVAAVLVHGSDPTVVPTEGEDRDGVADLPSRRVLVAAATGGAVGAILAIVVGATMSLAGGAVLALVVFLGATGVALGGIV